MIELLFTAILLLKGDFSLFPNFLPLTIFLMNETFLFVQKA